MEITTGWRQILSLSLAYDLMQRCIGGYAFKRRYLSSHLGEAAAYTRTISSTTWAHCSQTAFLNSLSQWWAGALSKRSIGTKYLSTPIAFSPLPLNHSVKLSVWRSWSLMPIRTGFEPPGKLGNLFLRIVSSLELVPNHAVGISLMAVLVRR